MINIHDSLSSLRKQAQEAAQARDAAALMRLHNPDDQGLLEALNSATAELAQIEDSIELFEASHRAQSIAKKSEQTVALKEQARAAYEVAMVASNTLLDLAPQIDATILSLSELLYAWKKAANTRANAVGNIVASVSDKDSHHYDSQSEICAIARGFLSQPLTQAIIDSNLRDAMGQCGDISSSLISRSDSINAVAHENHAMLVKRLDRFMEVIA